MSEIEKIKKVVELLSCSHPKVILRDVQKKKRSVSGVIFCNNEKYPVKYSLPILIPLEYRRRYNKLRAVYEAIGVSKWRASRSDWVKHMRILHFKGLRELANKLEEKQEAKILFLGCGWGWEIWAFNEISKNKHFLLGLDLSRRPLLVAREIAIRKRKRNVVLGVGITDILPFRNEVFDAVVAIFGPLDHTQEYVRAFKEISRVTKKGGYFFFTVLNKFALDWMLKVITTPKLYLKTIKKAKERFVRITIPTPIKTYRIPTHYYDMIEINKLMKATNFKIIKSWSIFSILPAKFKEAKFNKIHKLLSKTELLVADKKPFKWLGRYIAILAKKY